MALEQQPLLDLLKSKDWTLIKSFKEKYIQLLKQYYYIGGMPEVILSYRTQNDFKEVRVIQKVHKAFKLFITDVGLMGAMGDIDVRTLLEGNMIFEEFKGALTEQYVLQPLTTIPDLVIYYWSAERSNAEIEFLIQYTGEIIPIEVKAKENLQAKSLKAFCQKYSPKTAIRISMSDYRKEG